MEGLRILIQFFWKKKKQLPPVFEAISPLFFSFTSFVKRSDQGSPWEVPLGSLGFPQLNIIDFTNHRPKMAAFSLKTFRLFFWTTDVKLSNFNLKTFCMHRSANISYNKHCGIQKLHLFICRLIIMATLNPIFIFFFLSFHRIFCNCSEFSNRIP